MFKKKGFVNEYFDSFKLASKQLDRNTLESFVTGLSKIKKNNGRLFFLGVGGSAGNCSHAVNDFRKLCNFEAYAPTDNVSELTARINDEGWDNSFLDWLITSKLKSKDALFIFSVGGGNKKLKISTNLIKAIDYGKKIKSKIFGIVGRSDGYLYKNVKNIVLIPNIDKNLITPHSESFQAVIWHCLVSHPLLQENKTKW